MNVAPPPDRFSPAQATEDPCGRAIPMAAIADLRLQYGRPPRGLRRGWRWAAVLAAVLVAGGMAAGWPRVRPWVQQQAYLRRQRRCMAYVAPPADTVAYEEVP